MRSMVEGWPGYHLGGGGTGTAASVPGHPSTTLRVVPLPI
jgi:hypothetical protein